MHQPRSLVANCKVSYETNSWLTAMSRILNVLIALDQFLFCLLTLGGSFPDETASSGAWRSEQQGRWQGKLFRPLIDWLFWPIQRDHCMHAYNSERNKLQLPRDMR